MYPYPIFQIFLLTVIYNRFFVDSMREKRFLQYPPKTNIVITMSLLKLLPTEKILNTLTELDVLFPIPAHPFDLHPRKKRAIERNLLHKGLREAYENFGMEGDACLRKLVCEVRNSLMDGTDDEDNVLKDLFNVIFDPKGKFGVRACNSKMINNCRLPTWF